MRFAAALVAALACVALASRAEAQVVTYYYPGTTTYYAPSVPVTTYYAPTTAYYAPDNDVLRTADDDILRARRLLPGVLVLHADGGLLSVDVLLRAAAGRASLVSGRLLGLVDGAGADCLLPFDDDTERRAAEPPIARGVLYFLGSA